MDAHHHIEIRNQIQRWLSLILGLKSALRRAKLREKRVRILTGCIVVLRSEDDGIRSYPTLVQE